MTPEAVDLFLGHVFRMNELSIAILFRSIHMAEKALLFWRNALTFRNSEMTLPACEPCLQCLIMGEAFPGK